MDKCNKVAIIKTKMVCKGLCQQFRELKSENGGIYEEGMKRCTKCDVNMKLEQLRCPCCNGLLRTKPRQGRLKNKILRKQVRVNYF